MGLGTGATAAIGAGVGAAGNIAGSLIQGHAAGKAADAQAQAAEEAAQLQFQEAQQALGFQEQQYANTLALEEPGYLTGNESLGTLAQFMGLSPVAPNMSVFSNPFGANGPPTAANPGHGNSTVPLASLMNPQSSLAPVQTNSDLVATPGNFPSSGEGNPIQATADGVQATARFRPPNQINDVGGPNGPPLEQFPFRNPNLPPGGPVRNPVQGPATISANGSPAQTTVTSPAGDPGTVGSTGLPSGFLAQTWDTPFVPPTDVTEQNDPGFQFRLQQGQQALENSAAARGGLLSGGTAKALERYGQDYASNEYQNVYNRSLTDYQQAYNIFNQNQANIFNRYAALAGIGQTSAQQLSNAGLTTGANVGNTLLTSGAQIGQDLNNAAAARASGYIGAANAYGNALGILGGLGSLLPLYSLLGGQGGGF